MKQKFCITSTVINTAVDWLFNKKYGDIYISAGGGTINVLSGEVALFTGLDFFDVRDAVATAIINRGGLYWGGHFLDINSAFEDDEDYTERDARDVYEFLQREFRAA